MEREKTGIQRWGRFNKRMKDMEGKMKKPCKYG